MQRCFSALLGAALLALASPAQAAPGALIVGGLSGSWPSTSDSSAAMSPTHSVQLVNRTVRIGLRSGIGIFPIANFTQDNFAGVASGLTYANDIIWDDRTQRFLVVVVSAVGNTGSRIALGWSKTATPSSLNDWCFYAQTFTGVLVAYPTIGDTTNRIVIGYSRFNRSTGAFIASDLSVTAKPAAGATCPAGPNNATVSDLRTTTGQRLFAPAVANQIDHDPNGYAAATVLASPTTLAPQIGLVRIL